MQFFPVWAGNIVLNPDFSVSGPPSLYSAIPEWTASTPSNSGSSNGDPFWDNGTVPAGISSVGFIQVNPNEGGGPLPTDSLSQDLTLDPGITYNLSYLENARGSGYASPQVEVLVGGSAVVAQSVVTAVGGANPFELVTSSFTATDSTETLEFLVTQQNSNDDATFLVTNVSVSSAPEPATAGLLLSALCVMGFAYRCRSRRRPTNPTTAA